MAEKREERIARKELLSVVVNFESLRFMTLIKKKCLISDLITEAEKTFTKLCATKVTIKTLKNSVNAVLPDWYPVAPLIKNGDEIFAFRDTTADVLNNTFSKPTLPINQHFTKNTSTNMKTLCSSTVVHNSGFSSGIIFENDHDNSTDQIRRPGDDLSDHESEKMSETFSLQVEKRNNRVVNNNQGFTTEKLKNVRGEKCRGPEDDESKMKNDNKVDVTGKEGKKSVNSQKSKNHDTSNRTEGSTSNLQKTAKVTKKVGTNKLDVSVGGRSSILDHSKVHKNKSAQKLPAQSTVKFNVECAKSRSKSNSSSSESSDESSWTSDEDKERQEETLVQKDSPVDSGVRGMKGDLKSDLEGRENISGQSKTPSKGGLTNSGKKIPSKDDSSDSSSDEEEEEADLEGRENISGQSKMPSKGGLTNSGKKIPSKDDSSDSSSDEEEEDMVPNNISNNTSMKSGARDDKKVEGNSGSGVDDGKTSEKMLPGRVNDKSRLPKNTPGKLKDKSGESSDDDKGGTIETVSAKENEDAATKKSANDDVPKGGEVSENETSSITTSDSCEQSAMLTKAMKKLRKEAKNAGPKKSRIISIKFPTPTKVDRISDKVSPAQKIKTEEVSSSNSDEESSWTTSGEINSTKKTPQDDDKGGNGKASKDEASEGKASKVKESEGKVNEGKASEGKDKAMAGTAEDSDNESSDSSSTDSKKPFTQVPAKDCAARSKNVVGTTAHQSNGSDKKEKVKTTEAAVDTDNESMSDSSSEKLSTQPPTKTISKANGAARYQTRSSSKSPDKKATAKPVELATADSDDTSSDSNSSDDRKNTTLPAKSENVPYKASASKSSDDSDNTVSIDAKNTTGKNARSSQSKNNVKKSVSPKKTIPKTPMKQSSKTASTQPPQSPFTPRSRVAVVDKSNSKVASWLLANDVSGSGSCGNTSTSQGRVMTRAQKAKKSVKSKSKAHGQRESKEEQPQENKKTTSSGAEQDQKDGQTLGSSKTDGKPQKRKQNESVEQSPSKNAKRRRKKKKPLNDKNNGDNKSETGKNETSLTMQKPVDSIKRKSMTLTLPKKSKGLSALLEDDDDFDSFQTPKPKRTPVWKDRPKPSGFLTPSTSAERQSVKETRSGKRRTKSVTSSQVKENIELNIKEKELLSSGVLNLETLLNDENIKW